MAKQSGKDRKSSSAVPEDDTKRKVIIWVAAAAIFLVLAFLLIAKPFSPAEPAGDPTVATEPTAGEPVQPAHGGAAPDSPGVAEDVTALQVEDITVGDGPEAVAGKLVSVHYTGWLTDGTKFDSSLDSGQPFEFPLGQGQVIPGWDQGVAGMKVGGKRRLTIPPDLGYGEQGAGGVIPPGATLVFEVELLGVN